MPLYEYKCSSCNAKIEVIQRVSDPPYGHCPKCGGEMKKVISAPAIQFKGSGFYKTDYATPKSGGKSESSVESKSETKSETKSESKSESKSSD
jgi:putative FmdB family regulatory protein